MLRILLIRPGSTAFDDQGRIKGNLDMPLSQNGSLQVSKTAQELANVQFDAIYSAPCESAQQTARSLAQQAQVRAKIVRDLRNVDHGLWQGKLIEEVRLQQPKVYKQFQEHPENVCPPGGETIESVRLRLRKAITKYLRRHDQGIIGLVAPEPVATLIRSTLLDDEPGDLWKSECDRAQWELLHIEPQLVTL